MEIYGICVIVLVTTVLTSYVSARAVNISNTWMLPEEGFPVFYRYFRDRISWYEADAVCQFHHANLVTADSTSQYDAIRAYLKELDITENIWIGLSKTTERPHFQWTNFQPLNGEGHWQQPIPKSPESICVAMDPAADFLWKPMTCGGPDVASFICELPVPSWAMGPKGCLLTELPSMTVLYIPEQLALELTSDCGLDGTKRIVCKGDADREDILKQLTCAISPDEFEDKSTRPPVSLNTMSNTISDMSPDDIFISGKSTKIWTWTSNTIDVDYDMPTRHRRETEDTLSPSSTKSTTQLLTHKVPSRSKATTVQSTNYNTDTTVSTPEEVTLDLIDSQKTEEVKTSQVPDPTTSVTEETGGRDEVMGSSTEDARAASTEVEDIAEYPSAIAQGQLFSFIENGTMFDIIEVNETTSDDLKLTKEITMSTPQTETTNFKTTSDTSDSVYTTVIYHKEPPSETNFVTNRSIKKNDKQLKKHMIKDIDAKKSKLGILNKGLSKEVEMTPVAPDSLVKLNRTFRKELPVSKDVTVSENDDTHNVSDKHQHVEIKWLHGSNNSSQMKLFITTKRLELRQVIPMEQKIEFSNNTEDSKTRDEKSKVDAEKEILDFSQPQIQFLPKKVITGTVNEISSINASSAPGEPAEPEPEAQPRPNRQRQLTRPQRRSFYPYFFSRVLG